MQTSTASRFFLVSYQMSLMRRGWSNLTCNDGQNHPAQTIMMMEISRSDDGRRTTLD